MEALDQFLDSLDGETEYRSEVYQVCLDIFRHASEEHDYMNMTGFFASVGRLIRRIELDIRSPVAQKRYGLRGHKDQYVRILFRRLDNYLY